MASSDTVSGISPAAAAAAASAPPRTSRRAQPPSAPSPESLPPLWAVTLEWYQERYGADPDEDPSPKCKTKFANSMIRAAARELWTNAFKHGRKQSVEAIERERLLARQCEIQLKLEAMSPNSQHQLPLDLRLALRHCDGAAQQYLYWVGAQVRRRMDAAAAKDGESDSSADSDYTDSERAASATVEEPWSWWETADKKKPKRKHTPRASAAAPPAKRPRTHCQYCPDPPSHEGKCRMPVHCGTKCRLMHCGVCGTRLAYQE
jgi:hypothetical protein